MGKKLLGFVISLVLMFNITYKFWLPNPDTRGGDSQFMTVIQNINTPYFKISEEEKYTLCYMENPGGDLYHRSLWLAIPTEHVMQIRALSAQEIRQLQQQAR